MPTIHYFWDEIEDNVVGEYDENGNTLTTYTTEPTRYGSVLSQNRSGEKRYFHFDGQGNTTELTDEAGNVTDTRRYTAFGESTATSGATSTPFEFGGRLGYHSSGGGPISIRRRQYESRATRWMSADPLGIAALRDASLYCFVWNCPPSRVDPSGLVPVLEIQLANPGEFLATGSDEMTWSKKPGCILCGGYHFGIVFRTPANEPVLEHAITFVQHIRHIETNTKCCQGSNGECVRRNASRCELDIYELLGTVFYGDGKTAPSNVALDVWRHDPISSSSPCVGFGREHTFAEVKAFALPMDQVPKANNGVWMPAGRINCGEEASDDAGGLPPRKLEISVLTHSSTPPDFWNKPEFLRFTGNTSLALAYGCCGSRWGRASVTLNSMTREFTCESQPTDSRR